MDTTQRMVVIPYRWSWLL